MNAKKEIRQLVRQRKKNRLKEAEVIAEKSCYERVLSLKEWQHAKTVFLYISYNHEMGTGLLINEALRLGKKVAAPRIEGKEMNFYLFSSVDELVSGAQGILEPLPCEEADDEHALMIMPGVAFDLKRNRIGYGGGFYDKYIEKHPGHFKVALAFDDQIFDSVISMEHDIRPDLIVTESRII